ncbi:hypothetical protein [Fuscibacter oryzae]|uniref:Uncharacterized protein n=1 Tax=Fuscibacter oryzae TaxID=2803939 RepID=A0A8J7STP0_9RHOB|nr:hypothetical protein [Fuscibacter oryzae]MBL4928760.1 hypothetical protein [Fuscibacter oryzae]
MPAKQLSRWTMAWFGAALLFLLLSLTLALGGAVGPSDWSRGVGLAGVHLFTLGWLCLAMLGALIQFVPVLAARPPVLPVLALPALLAGIGGTVALATGFLWLDGHEAVRGAFLVAPVLLAVAFGLAAAMIVPLLLVRASHKLAEVQLALVALAALWASGAAMTYNLSGIDLMPAFLPDGLGLHVLLGVAGWLSLAAFGVSYTLFAMFLLAPEGGAALRLAVRLAAGLTLGLILLAGMLLLVQGVVPAVLLWCLTALLPAVVALYLAEVARIWRLRRRADPEGNMRWSRVALAFLGLAALLAGPALWLGGRWAEAAIFVALVGWLSLLTLAQMVKIVSFLTWIQVFAPLIGRAPVPLVHHLTDPRATTRWLSLWGGGGAVGGLALLLVQPLVFRLSVAALLLAALGLGAELVAIRRLSHLDPQKRPATLPPVIFPAPDKRSAHDHARTA